MLSREEIINQISNISKEELIDFIYNLQKETSHKKYGLVWNNNDVEEKDKCPYLINLGKDIIKNKDNKKNLLIQGDNLDTLKILKHTYFKKIDVIYIDPPYNTGNEFIYNDKLVNKEDNYRHSKWIDFMYKRLIISKDLLNDKGFIFISIDDNELTNLKLICDEIYGESNFIGCLPRKTKSSGKSTSTIAKNHDYLLIYSKNINIKLKGLKHNDKGFKFKDKHFEKRGFYKLNQTLDYNSLEYSKNLDYEIVIDKETFLAGGDYNNHIERINGNHSKKDWIWRWSYEKFKFGLDNDFIIIKKSKNNRPRIYTKTYLNAQISKKDGKYYIEEINREKKLTSLEFIDNKYSNDNGTKAIKDILGANSFQYVKPIELIKTILKLFDNDIIILDFFAGSGTTGQAVMELNNEDKGTRQFILCTNNENNICDEITYKRLFKIINGYTNFKNKKIKGLDNNLIYYKVDYLYNKKDSNIEDN